VARAKAELREHLVRAGSWERIGGENFHPSVRSAVQFALNERAGTQKHPGETR
jgi:hypothetical protein